LESYSLRVTRTSLGERPGASGGGDMTDTLYLTATARTALPALTEPTSSLRTMSNSGEPLTERAPAPAFVLLHGTWARNAPWTSPQGPVAEALRARFGAESVVVPHPWSGRNRIADRRAAADELQVVVSDLARQNPERPLFLIGHSHGGSAIAFALARGTITASVAGAVFLSTPFFSMAVRSGSAHVLHGALFSLLAASLACLSLTLGYVAPDMDVLEHPWTTASWVLGTFGLTAILATLFLRRAGVLTRVADGWLARASADAAHSSTPAPADVPALFMRVTADEIVLGLGTLQALATVAGIFATLAGRMSSLLYAGVRRLQRSLVGKAVLGAAFLGGTLLSFWHGETARDDGSVLAALLDLPVAPFAALAWAIRGSEGFFAYAVAASMVPFGLLILGVLVVGVTLLFATLLSTITLIAFGRFAPVHAVITECAAEVVPVGRSVLIHVPWERETTKRAYGRRPLWHSEVYLSGFALSELEAWIQTQLHARASSGSASAQRAAG
jgi:hypothetical protein